jgi:T4 RnlA family RNA ligase
MKLQEEIRYLGLDKVVEMYKLKVIKHSVYPNLIMLKYNQIESPMDSISVQQARGIIFDSSPSSDNGKRWEIVNYTFNKFFNLKEGNAAKIDWNSAICLDKLDGSLCQMYFYNDKWHFATSGTPDGSGKMNDYPWTFAQAFERAFNNFEGIYPINTDYCYALEYIGPYNRIIVEYNSESIITLGGRNINSRSNKYLNQISALEASNHLNIRPVTLIHSGITSKDLVLNAVKTLKANEQEGYVVIDKYFNRVKVKSPDYIARHHFKSSFSLKNAIDVVLKGEIEEVIISDTALVSKFKDYELILRLLKARLLNLETDLYSIWNKHGMIENRKEFAIKVKDLPLSVILFQMMDGKIKTIKEGIQKQSPEKLLSLIKTDDLIIPNPITIL